MTFQVRFLFEEQIDFGFGGGDPTPVTPKGNSSADDNWDSAGGDTGIFSDECSRLDMAVVNKNTFAHHTDNFEQSVKTDGMKPL